MGERVRLVPLDGSHLGRTREWANDPFLMRLMDRQHPVSAAEHEVWFTSVVRGGDCAYFAIETVEGDYRSHAAAARELAADQFGSGKVLTRMLDDIFSADAGRPA